MKKKILVTGGGGFIGSHLVEALVKKGHKVKALVEYNTDNTWGWIDSFDPIIKKSVEVISGDIRDQNLVIKYRVKTRTKEITLEYKNIKLARTAIKF